MDQKEIKMKIRKHFELNENESPKYWNVWNEAQATLERKLTAPDAYISNKGKSQITDLGFHFMKLEEQIKPKVSGRKQMKMWTGWEGGPRGRRHMYTYDWFILMFGRNQQNSVKQSFFN